MKEKPQITHKLFELCFNNIIAQLGPRISEEMVYFSEE